MEPLTIESDSFLTLPTINRIKPGENTPRIAGTKSPVYLEKVSRSPVYNTLSSKKKQIEDLVITKLEDNKKKKLVKLSLPNENDSSSTKKLIKTLKKKVLEQELCIDSLKSMLQSGSNLNSHKPSINNADFLTETVSSLNKRTEAIKTPDKEEFSRNLVSRTKYKDKEIFYLKQELTEYNSQFDSVSHELLYLKDQNKKLLLKLNLQKSKTLEYENVRKDFQENLRKAENEIGETDLLLSLKQSEVEELTHLLHRSEENRKLAVEHSSYLEQQLYTFQEKVQKLKEKNHYLTQEIENITQLYVEKDNKVEELCRELAHTESKISSKKTKVSGLQMENEKLQVTLLSVEERFSEKLERLAQENNDLQEKKRSSLNSNRSPSTRCTTKRSGTEIESRFLSKLTSEEITRWQQRYFSIEQDLLSKEQLLEKISRDEMYLHTQIDTKNVIIQRLEDMIQKSEPPNANFKENSSVSFTQVNEAYKVLLVLDKMKIRIKELLGILKCDSCFKVKSWQYICNPCGHLCCESCKEMVDVICAACTEKVTFMAPVKYLGKVIEGINEEKEDLDTLTSIANGLTLEGN